METAKKEVKTKKKPIPPCEKCGDNNDVIPAGYGKPSAKGLKEAKEGKVKLLGCCIPAKEEDRMSFYCKKCEVLFKIKV